VAKKFFMGFVVVLMVHVASLANELKKVTLHLSWFDQFQFAGYYMAKQKGFYEQAGLDVTIIPFEFGVDIPLEVSKGNVDFAVGRETLILERAKNRDIVALYALFQATPLVLLSTKDSKIKSVADFKQKRIMTTIDDSSEVSLKAMISSHNVRLDDLKFVKHTHNIMDLVNGETDVISAYLSKSPFELEQRGIEYNVFDPKKYGFDMYSDFLYTNEKLIEKDFQTVNAFRQASLQGWNYAYENINETVEHILDNYNPQNLSKEELVFEANELKKLSFFNTKTLGDISKEKLQRIYDLYNVMGLVPNQIKIDDFTLKPNLFQTIHYSQAEINYMNQKDTLTMCIIPNVMPYAQLNDQKLTGLLADYVPLLEQKSGFKINITPTNNMQQTLQYLQENRCEGLLMGEITQERKEYLNFTAPYLKVPFVLVTSANEVFYDNISSIQNKNIAVVKGYAISDLLKRKYPNFEFVEVDSFSQAFEKIEQHEVFGTITPLAIALYTFQTKPIHNLKISAKLEEQSQLRVGINKEDTLLFSIMNKTVESIDEQTIEKLLNKWLYIQYEKRFDYTFLIQLTFVFALIIAAILYRHYVLKNLNRSLEKKVDEKTKALIKINNELEQRIQQEVEKNVAKDRMLSKQTKMAAMGEMMENIAHQWRQPLSVISTGASGIKLYKEMGCLNDKTLQESLDNIIETSQYLSHTIDDFRDFFKPKQHKDEFYIHQCFTKILKLFSSNFKHIVIHQNIQRVQVYGFESELIQVLINILNNAKDALEHNKIENPMIFIDVYRQNSDLIITIKDNANGIPENIIDKVTEPYFTTKHKSQGTGVGLYMCEEILKKHMNASLKIYNETFVSEGVSYAGAVFTITMMKACV
jgi:signal transduction histidine kinase/ABC-type nitrate/sulfonate/bicarbonate transport system substrate-binding protein